jgi:P4 family phage/plasmid primase-like protien
MACQYRNLDDFLSKHKINKSEERSPTHTRIGDKTLDIYPGSYFISDEEKDIFYELYHKKVFQEKKPEFLTEKQIKNGPILVDFDLKFSLEVDTRLYTDDHLMDILNLYLDTLKTMVQFTNTPFHVFIMEKKDVNRCVDKGLTKDGIHMIIGIQMDHTLQMMLRKRILQEIPQLWGEDEDVLPLPITNAWDNVVDDTICRGTTNWQVFGSRKPAHEAYHLTNHFTIIFDNDDSEFSIDKNNIKIDKNLLSIISAQNPNNPLFLMKPELTNEYNQYKLNPVVKQKRKSVMKFNVVDIDTPQIEDIKNREQLDKAMSSLLDSFNESEYILREMHEYVQILPESYYEDGSHLKNRQVAFALKHTDDRLFLSWVMLRAKSPSFDYSDIPTLLHQWNNYFNKKDSALTHKSIIYWAKNDSPRDKFLEVKRSSLNHFIEETLVTASATDYDIANVLYQMNKDQYCCVNIGLKQWYVFENHRWVEDKSMGIRNKLSEEVFRLYFEKTHSLRDEMQVTEDTDRHDFLSKQINKISSTCIKLKKTADKNNIFREAMEIFYDGKFMRSIDSNKYLMCFKNGVVDMKTKTFRPGTPEDYITKCTNNDYFKDIGDYIEDAKKIMENPDYQTILNRDIINIIIEIYEYMNQLYPIPNLNEYMWCHLSSCLIGENINQTCSFYIGSGSNGKSSIVELMSYGFGDYKGVLPITIVTEKRAGVGGTTSELIALKGVRYAVMQESSKGMRINEGILKELTGGDTIVGRQLFKESETFTPQFSLVVCTNNLPEVDATDDGTWRRVKSIPHHAKFVDNIQDERYSSCPYLFKKDKNVKDRLKVWAPIFMSMLVHKVFETGGIVEDCEEVLKHSEKYRESQDHIACFMREMVLVEKGGKIKKQELTEQFNLWFKENYGGSKMPKGAEVITAISAKYGDPTRHGWPNIKINYISKDDIEDI